jgi:hypothetical protein
MYQQLRVEFHSTFKFDCYFVSVKGQEDCCKTEAQYERKTVFQRVLNLEPNAAFVLYCKDGANSTTFASKEMGQGRFHFLDEMGSTIASLELLQIPAYDSALEGNGWECFRISSKKDFDFLFRSSVQQDSCRLHEALECWRRELSLLEEKTPVPKNSERLIKYLKAYDSILCQHIQDLGDVSKSFPMYVSKLLGLNSAAYSIALRL